jgi:lipoprotein-anchoring transpeptidase ErfK/SrfK
MRCEAGWDEAMRDRAPRRAALLTGICVAALLSAGVAAGMASPRDDRIPQFRAPGAKFAKDRPVKPSKAKSEKAKPDSTPVIPPGQLHVIVSIERQNVTLYVDGKPFATSTISSGTPDHPTPMGVFSVIQKRRHHVSNLYAAEMPFMQRLTWSGTAMHQGPLPGRPASHGCIRLPKDFAQLLWKATKIGARVVIAAKEAAPTEIAHERLFTPGPVLARAADAADARASGVLIKTADATDVLRGTVVPDAGKVMVADAAVHLPAAEQATKLSIAANGDIEMSHPAPRPAEAAPINPPAPIIEPPPVAALPPAPMPQATAKRGPLSVFVSRKEAKLYVRQGMEPLFEAPVTFDEPDRPIGTHVYTAMGAQNDDGGLRWTVVSIPSHYLRPGETGKKSKKTAKGEKAAHKGKAIHAAPALPAPVPDAGSALDRIVMPQDAVERIAALIVPGSSLIVSDNKLSGETGRSTDFIVLTP